MNSTPMKHVLLGAAVFLMAFTLQNPTFMLIQCAAGAAMMVSGALLALRE